MKKVIIGFIAGALFATAGTAAASTIIEKVTASVRTDYSVEVDGEEIALENAPLAYKGSAYIAVREISNVIGKDVGFEDGVIKISTPREVSDVNIENMNITQVNSEISLAESAISLFEWSVKASESRGQDATETKAKLQEMKQRLAELQARKAELEAQQ